MCQRERAGQRCLVRGTHEAFGLPKKVSRLPFLPILRLLVGCFSGATWTLGAHSARVAIVEPLGGFAAMISGPRVSSRGWLLCERDCQQKGSSTSAFAASRLTGWHGRRGEERWPHDD